MSVVIWYLDRATALLTYPSLYLAVLTGVVYNADSFGSIRDAARRVHIEIAVFAMLLTLAHAGLGLADAYLVATGQAPMPNYTLSYFLAGVVVGGGALLLLVVAVLGFLDPRRFDRPWGPRVVHAFAYVGFAFGTVHAVAIGTDLVSLARPVIVTSLAFLVYVLLLRVLTEWGGMGTATPH